MRFGLLVMLVAACVWCVGAQAWAQGARVDVDKGSVSVDVNAQGMDRGGQIIRAGNVNGLKVYSPDNKSLGKIEDIVLDLKTGKIRYAVLSFGGFLGMGDKYFAIPWQKLSFVSKGETNEGTAKERYAVLDITKDTLKSAPGFDKDHWPNFADANWRQTIEGYYNRGNQASGQRNPQR
ncbi:MAG: PRC-barrel domain-containing protein [Planctomycetaceae bacterium]|nr:PRC-barrel domain-containing protein [Planctomycetaceae bacterium]